MRLYPNRKTWILGWAFILPHLIFAQPAPLKVLAGQMDRRVGHSVLMFHALETLNISLLEWSEDNSRYLPTPFPLPSLSRQTQPDWERMSPLIRKDLQDKWKHHQRVAAKLSSTYELLSNHVKQELYREDEGLYVMGSLRRMLVMMEDLRTLQAEMYFLMRQGFRRGLTPPDDPLARRATLALDSVLNLSREMLIVMRFGPYSRIHEQADRLSELIQRARILQPSLKKAPYKRPDSNNDAFRQYALVIKQAISIEEAARSYGPEMPLPLRYRRYGRQYHLFNHQLNLRFSAEGEGLVEAFNRWCKLADPVFLSQIRELPWIMPLDPPVPEAPVPTELTGAAPQNLVFLIDVSASMNEADRLPLFQAAFGEMANELRATDHIGLVSFAGEAKEVLEPTSGELRRTIVQALANMQGEGKTEILPGFEAAYEAAGQHLSPETNSRVLLVTDGEFSIRRELLQLISSSLREGVSLTILFLGEMNEEMNMRMSRLAEVGGGHYHRLAQRDAKAKLVQAILTPAQKP